MSSAESVSPLRAACCRIPRNTRSRYRRSTALSCVSVVTSSIDAPEKFGLFFLTRRETLPTRSVTCSHSSPRVTTTVSLFTVVVGSTTPVSLRMESAISRTGAVATSRPPPSAPPLAFFPRSICASDRAACRLRLLYASSSVCAEVSETCGGSCFVRSTTSPYSDSTAMTVPSELVKIRGLTDRMFGGTRTITPSLS